MWHSTGRTYVNRIFMMATVVTVQQIRGLMIRHTDITVHTFSDITTGAALQKRRVPSSILKQNNLFLTGYGLRYIFQQYRAKIAPHLLLPAGFCDIDNFYLWQLCITEALQQLYQPIFTRFGIVITFDRWCRGT